MTNKAIIDAIFNEKPLKREVAVEKKVAGTELESVLEVAVEKKHKKKKN